MTSTSMTEPFNLARFAVAQAHAFERACEKLSSDGPCQATLDIKFRARL